MRYLYRLQNILAIFFAVVLLSGCLDDNLAKCRSYIQFEYTLHNYGGDRLRDEVKSVTLYIYNKNGDFRERKQVEIDQLDSDNRVQIQLPSAEHSIIAWGNYNEEYYKCESGNTLTDNAVKIVINNPNNEVAEIPAPLFYGFVQVSGKRNVTHKISFTKDKSHIKVILKEAPTTRTNNRRTPNYSVNISSCNGAYKYDNSMADNTKQLQYIPTYSYLGKDLHADFSIMKLAIDGDTRITITDNKDQSVKIDQLVAQEIVAAPGSDLSTQRDFDRYDYHTLTYEIMEKTDGTYAVVLIKINDWDIINSGGGV